MQRQSVKLGSRVDSEHTSIRIEDEAQLIEVPVRTAVHAELGHNGKVILRIAECRKTCFGEDFAVASCCWRRG